MRAKPMVPLILVLLVVLHAVACLVLRAALRRRAGDGGAHAPSVSVVVAARDEVERIPLLLSDLQRQSYTDFEVVVVDDRSTDGTGERVREIALRHPRAVRLLRRDEPPRRGSPKAAALQHGVGAARGEVVLLTDADARVPPGWVEAMARGFRADTALLLGPVEYRWAPGDGWFRRLQAAEYLALNTLMLASASLGRPLGASGLNLAVRRAAFERVGGFRSGAHLPAGDDMVLLHAVLGDPGAGRVHATADPGACVATHPAPTLAAYLNQHRRWASSGTPRFARDPAVAAFAAATVCAGVAVTAGPLLVAAGRLPLPLWAALAALKIASDVWLYGAACQRFARRDLRPALVPWSLLQPLYLLFMGLAGARPRFTWKPAAPPAPAALDSPGA